MSDVFLVLFPFGFLFFKSLVKDLNHFGDSGKVFDGLPGIVLFVPAFPLDVVEVLSLDSFAVTDGFDFVALTVNLDFGWTLTGTHWL
jgi:hypothetical protein